MKPRQHILAVPLVTSPGYIGSEAMMTMIVANYAFVWDSETDLKPKPKHVCYKQALNDLMYAPHRIILFELYSTAPTKKSELTQVILFAIL